MTHSKLNTEEAKTICKNCKERFIKKYSDIIDCAFRHDNEYCSRIEDIDLLIERLYKENE